MQTYLIVNANAMTCIRPTPNFYIPVQLTGVKCSINGQEHHEILIGTEKHMVLPVFLIEK